MAYIYLSKGYVTPSNTQFLLQAKPLDAKYHVEYINDLWKTVPDQICNKQVDMIAEGQQIFITKGTNWDTSSEDVLKAHKGEIWVLIDKSHITKPIFEYNPETGIETKTEGPHGWRLLGQESHGLNWEKL